MNYHGQTSAAAYHADILSDQGGHDTTAALLSSLSHGLNHRADWLLEALNALGESNKRKREDVQHKLREQLRHLEDAGY